MKRISTIKVITPFAKLAVFNLLGRRRNAEKMRVDGVVYQHLVQLSNPLCGYSHLRSSEEPVQY